VKTAKKGYGVCAQVDISRGMYVGEYVGEVISGSQAKERLESQQNTSLPCYVVQYREHTATGTVVTTNIDATYKGNIMRFVNHSCSPNLVMVAVRSDSIVPRLCLFASKDISTGEELCFSYYGSSGAEVNKEALQLGKQPCYCGSVECVRFLPLEL
jgi:SET domain-containing protein